MLESALWLSALLGAVIVLALAFRPVLEGGAKHVLWQEYFNHAGLPHCAAMR
ncbi:hypothetical protein ACU4GD_39675 [Cupriavidus basilensis]